MIESGSVELQARTVPAWNSQRLASVNGTVLGAVAARVAFLQSNVSISSSQIHIEMPTDRTSSKISVITRPIITLRYYLASKIVLLFYNCQTPCEVFQLHKLRSRKQSNW